MSRIFFDFRYFVYPKIEEWMLRIILRKYNSFVHKKIKTYFREFQMPYDVLLFYRRWVVVGGTLRRIKVM